VDERFHFNTAIAAAMELVNEMAAFTPDSPADRQVFREAVEALTKLLAPMVPHLGEEIWSCLGNTTLLADEPWPAWDEAARVKDSILIVVQVNGKVRGRLEVAPDAGEAEVKGSAFADANVARHLEDKTLVKAVYVPGRLLNLVVR
jgi:leucyl-tRNA synthetase